MENEVLDIIFRFIAIGICISFGFQFGYFMKRYIANIFHDIAWHNKWNVPLWHFKSERDLLNEINGKLEYIVKRIKLEN